MIRLFSQKDSIQKRAPRLCRMPDCHAISGWPMLQSEEAYTLNMRLDSPIGRGWIQKRAPRLCRMPDCHAASAWPMLRSEEVWTLDLRLDFSVRRVGMLEPAEGLCEANDRETQCAVTPPGDESQDCRRSQASSVARGAHRRLRVSWAYRLRGYRAFSVSHPPGGEYLAHLSFS